MGYHVLRISNSDVQDDLDHVMRLILLALEAGESTLPRNAKFPQG